MHVSARVQGEASAAHVVGARNARPRKGSLHPAIEFETLGPPARCGPRLGGVGHGRPGTIVKVTALGQNGNALSVLLPQGVEGLIHEIGAEHHLVVIQENDGVVPKNRRDGQTHISNSTVAA